MEVSEQKNTNKFLGIVKIISCLLLVCLTFCFGNVQAALAHTPHDDIYQVELSPTYDQDKTLYIIVRGIYLKSTDGGQSWKRVVRGLDNNNNLAALSTYAQTNKTLFLSSFGDGIYKSDDAGESWMKTNKGLDTLDIDLISISPHDADVVLAAGNSNGLYQTNDRGENWQQVFNQSNKVTAIAFFPDDRDQVMIGDSQGNLYLSDDAGDTWKPIFTFEKSDAVSVISFSPNFSSDNTFWIGTEKRGIFQTTDRGNSFSEVNKGLADKLIKDIVVFPTNETNFTLFTSTGNKGVFQSNDGGKTWTRYAKGLTKDSQADESNYENRDHFSDLAISPGFSQDRTLFLAGFNGLFKSANGGRVWQELETLSPRTIIALDVSPDYQNDSTIAIAAYNDEAYISNDQGNTWKPINKGLTIPRYKEELENPFILDQPRFYEIAFSPNYRSDQIMFAILSYKVLRSTNGGNHWDIVPLKTVTGYSTRGMLIDISPDFAKDKTVYLATRYGGLIYKSTNGGSKFSVVGKIDNQISSLAISPSFASDQTLYAVGGDGVYQSVDGGVTWQVITENPDLTDITWLQLAISPNYEDEQTVIAGTDQGLFETRDGGKNWLKLPGMAYGEKGYIEAIAISPNFQNDQTFLITVRGKGTYKTVDGGKTFREIDDLTDKNYALSPLLTVWSSSAPIHFSPAYANDNTIYGFGSARAEIFKSTDGGNTWKIITVPRTQDRMESFMNVLRLGNLVITIHPILRVLVALIVALPTYLFLGYFGLEKKLPLRKSHIRAGGAFTAFLAVLIVLSI